MHTLTINELKLSIPGNWNELNKEQLLSFAYIVRDNMELEEIKIKMLFLFTNIKVLISDPMKIDNVDHFWLIYKKKRFLISAFDLAFISQINMTYFKENDKNKYSIYPLLTKNLLPFIKIGKKCFFGPSDGLSNLLFKEYIHTETAFHDFVKNNDENALNKLIAILYRPAGKIKPDTIDFNGDIREPFNDFLIDDYAKQFAKVDYSVKRVILWYYEGCKRHLAELFPYVFKEGSDQGSDQNTFLQFMTIVDELANNQPAENEKIMNVYLYTALTSLNQRIAKIPKNGKV